MKKLFKKIKYLIAGALLLSSSVAMAVNITVPSAPTSGYDLTSTSTGAYISTTTSPRYFGSIYASSTALSNYIFGPFLLPSLSQGYSFIGSNGRLNTISTSTLASNLTALCATITGGSGLCDGVDDTSAGGNSLSTTSPWTFGNLVTALTNGTVTTISTSTLVNNIFPFTSYGASTSTIFGFTNGLFSLSSTTINGAKFTDLSQGIAYIGSSGKLNTTATSTFNLSQFTNDLASLSATDSTLTFSGSYNGATARTVGLNLANANTWTAKQTFNYSSSTIYSSFVTASTTFLRVGLADGCLNITGGLVGSTGSACGSASGLSSYDAWTHPVAGQSATTSLMLLYGNASTTGLSSNYASIGESATTTLAINGDVTAGDDFIVRNDNSFKGTDASGNIINMLYINSSNDAHFLPDLTGAVDSAYFGFNSPVPFQIGGSCCGGNPPTTFTVETSGNNIFKPGGSTVLTIANNSITSTQPLIFPYSSSTIYSSFLTASSTNLFTGFLTLSTTTAGTLKTTSAGLIWVDTSSGSAASSTLLADTNYFSGGNTFAGAFSLSALSQGFTYTGSNGLVSTISTSTLANYILPFTSYGASTSTVLGFTGGLFSTASSTFSSAFRLPSLSQGFPYIGSTGLVSTISTSTLAGQVFPFSTFTNYNATSTVLGLLGGFFSNASSTITTLDVNTELTVPDGGAPALSKIGSIAYDSTDKQLLIATTTANTPAVIPLISTIYSRTIASTSVDMVSGGRIGLPYRRDGFVITEIYCWTEGGTSAVINLDTNAGGSNTDTVTCDSDAQSDTSMGANYTIAAGTLMSLEFGTITGAVDYTHVTVYGFYTRE